MSAARHPSLDGVRRLLETLGIEGSERICIATLDAGSWHQQFVDARKAPGLLASDDVDAYLCPAVFRADASKRTVEHIERLTALVADLDYKPTGVIDQVRADAVVEKVSALIGERPRVLVASGHGQQAYWMLADGEGRDVRRAALVLARFGLLVRMIARGFGGNVDSVYTAEHVFRAPGTRNLKGAGSLPEGEEPPRVDARYDGSGGAVGLRLADLEAAMDKAMVPDVDAHEVGVEAISPPAEWKLGAGGCPYTTAMVAGWTGEQPTERNPWLFRQAIRLMAAVRAGCFTEEEAVTARDTLVDRFRFLMSHPSYEPRTEAEDEVNGILRRARDRVAAKTDEEVWRELGGDPHTHAVLDMSAEEVAEAAEAIAAASGGGGSGGAGDDDSGGGGGGGGDGEGSGSGSTKKLSLPVRMVIHVSKTYLLFVADGFEYAVLKDGGRIAERITQAFVIRACWRMGAKAATMSTAASNASVVLRAKAFEGPRLTLNLRSARWRRPGVEEGDGIVLDLAVEGTARCVVVTAEGWEIRDSPPEGVLFRRTVATRPLPDPVHLTEADKAAGQGMGELAHLLGMDLAKGGVDDRWLLIRGWLPAALVPDIPRPMLAIVGPAGSAKTTRAAMTAGVLDPQPQDTLGGGFAKTLADDQVRAVNRYLVNLDNTGRVTEEQSDFIARLVTGDSAETRRLYSDAELAMSVYQRTGIITAIAVPAVKSDALARLIPIVCTRVPDSYRLAEKKLWKAWHEAHPRMLGAVLDDVVTMLRRLPEVEDNDALRRPRMADFYECLYAVHPALAETYVDSAKEAMRVAAENDPFVMCVVAWLKEQPGGRWEGTPTEALKECSAFRSSIAALSEFGALGRWWPADGKNFSTTLDKVNEPLGEAGVTMKRLRTKTSRNIVLTYSDPEKR